VKKLTARSTRLCTLLVMLGLLAALIVAATAQAVAAAKPQAWLAFRRHDQSVASERRADATADRANQAAAVPLPSPSFSLDWDERLEMVYATVAAKVYRSAFAPANWSHIGTDGSQICQTYRHPRGEHVYALYGECLPGKTNALQRSDDWGNTWSAVTTIDKVVSFAIHPDDPNTLYVGRQGDMSTRGIWRSTDNGQTWTRLWVQCGDGILWQSCYVPYSLGISPLNPDLMFAGVDEAKGAWSDMWVMRSTDGGCSWSKVYTIHLGSGPAPTYVLASQEDVNDVYVALYGALAESGVLVSTNMGQSWTRETGFGSNAQRSTLMIAQSPTDPDTLYKTGGSAGGTQNVWRSNDGGDNWTQIVSGTNATFSPYWVAVSERTPDLFFLSGVKSDGAPRVYKSTNGGDTWSDFGAGQLTGGVARTLLLLETEGASHYFGLGYCPTGQCGDPVNTSIGNFAHQWEDLSIPGPGASLSVQRTYNSQDSYVGPLGKGWSLNYDMRLTSMATKVVEMKVEDGRRDRYISSDGETFIPPPGVNATLVRNDDDSYTLTREDQTRYNFDEDGYLTSIVTSNELTTTLTYSGTYLTNVTEPAGRSITFTWDITDGLITGVEDPLGRTVAYTYTSGDLISVADLRGHVATYAYTGTNGLLSSHTEAGTSTPRFVNWYSDDGQVTGQLLAGSTVSMTFEYDPDDRETTVTDARGKEQVHTYSIQLPLTDREDSYGNELHLTYDAHNNVTSVTDERDNQTEYAYDTSGNVTAIVDALDHEQTMTYDDHNNLESLTDARDVTTEYQYDGHDNLTAIVQYLDSKPHHHHLHLLRRGRAGGTSPIQDRSPGPHHLLRLRRLRQHDRDDRRPG
jgi:YD repeat-containing protein